MAWPPGGGPARLAAAALLVAAVASVRMSADVQEGAIANESTALGAGLPQGTIAADMLGVHDLLLLGYWGVMTNGPHHREWADAKVETMVSEENSTYLEWFKTRDRMKKTGDFEGLLAVQGAAVDLAHLLPYLHPVPHCRKSFSDVIKACRQDKACGEEDFITRMAAEAWECIGIKEHHIIPTCEGKGECSGSPITSLRNSDGSILQVKNILPYSNFRVEGIELGVCQHGPVGDDGYPTGSTKWVRACSYWTAFHSLALRADALGGHLPNILLGAVMRIVAGGALWCGG